MAITGALCPWVAVIMMFCAGMPNSFCMRSRSGRVSAVELVSSAISAALVEPLSMTSARTKMWSWIPLNSLPQTFFSPAACAGVMSMRAAPARRAFWPEATEDSASRHGRTRVIFTGAPVDGLMLSAGI
jgi:hypothetical protein